MSFATRKSGMLLAAIAATAVGAAPAFAQEPETAPPASSLPSQEESMPPQQESLPPDSTMSGAEAEAAEADTAATANIDQRKVEQFADALIAVQEIQSKANEDLQTKTDPAQANEVKAQAETDMISAVERSGLRVEEFNQISEVLASDVEFRSRVAAEVQKRRGG
jgi:hypothetical protein